MHGLVVLEFLLECNEYTVSETHLPLKQVDMALEHLLVMEALPVVVVSKELKKIPPCVVNPLVSAQLLKLEKVDDLVVVLVVPVVLVLVAETEDDKSIELLSNFQFRIAIALVR